MSLLQQINERNNSQAQQAQTAQQAQVAESQKPDAGAEMANQRSAYSNMMAQTPDEMEMMEEAPSPEEQEEFTQLELQVSEIVNGEKANEMFNVIQAAQDPVEGIGQVSHDIIKMITQSNPNISEDVLLGIGESVVEQVVQAYEDIDPSVNLNEDQVAEAFSIGLQEWMQENPNLVDPEMKQYLAGAAPSQL